VPAREAAPSILIINPDVEVSSLPLLIASERAWLFGGCMGESRELGYPYGLSISLGNQASTAAQ
jgi:hypothetical protein